MLCTGSTVKKNRVFLPDVNEGHLAVHIEE